MISITVPENSSSIQKCNMVCSVFFLGFKCITIPLDLIKPVQDLSAPQAKQTQPARNARPPRGVIAPSHRTPLMLNTYRLPENRMVPIANSHPPAMTMVDGRFMCAQATAISANA